MAPQLRSRTPERLLILATETKTRIVELIFLLFMRILATKSTSRCAADLEGSRVEATKTGAAAQPSGEAPDVRFSLREVLQNLTQLVLHNKNSFRILIKLCRLVCFGFLLAVLKSTYPHMTVCC